MEIPVPTWCDDTLEHLHNTLPQREKDFVEELKSKAPELRNVLLLKWISPNASDDPSWRNSVVWEYLEELDDADAF